MGTLIVGPPEKAHEREESQTRSYRPSALCWPPPHLRLRSCVVVPVRNEEERLPALIAALAGQHDLHGNPFAPATYETLLLLNNCTDSTAEVARALQRRHPRLHLHIAEIAFPSPDAHVGKARQALFDAAFQRFQSLQRPQGLILTTDADTRPSFDWIAENEAEIGRGVDAVGGRILLEPVELAALPAGVRSLFLLDIGYRRALEEMRSLYAPDAHDPFPRHHQNFGGSLAVTAGAFRRAGGMPLRRSREDVALAHAIVRSGGLLRHSPTVRVYTSGRMIGRAECGLADALGWWNSKAQSESPVVVESATAAESRFLELGIWCLDHPDEVPPACLTTAPDEPPPGQAADVRTTLRELRERLELLRGLTLSQRLQEPRSAAVLA